jgi:hypothetical protein
VINKLLSSLTSFRLRSRDRVDDPLAQLLSHMPPARDFVIDIDGWSKKAIYIEATTPIPARPKRGGMRSMRTLPWTPLSSSKPTRTPCACSAQNVLYEWHLETKARMREV